MKKLTLSLLAACTLIWPSVSAAQSKSLTKCQQAVGKESRKFIDGYTKEIGKCIDTVAKETVGGGEPTAKSSKACLKAFTKAGFPFEPGSLYSKLSAKVDKACDPSTNGKLEHAEADIFGDGALDEQIDAANLDTWCTRYFQGTSLDDLDEWKICILEATVCQARQALAVQYPGLLATTPQIHQSILNLDNTCMLSGGCRNCADAESENIRNACYAMENLDQHIEGSRNDNIPEINCGPELRVLDEPMLPATGQARTFGPGTDGDVKSGREMNFRDNNDGTITDMTTGLMWEKKDDSEGIHDKDNTYTWSGSSYGTTNELDGTVATEFLAALNAGDGFAGYTDWRLPNAKELQSIICFNCAFPSVSYPFHNRTSCEGCTDITDRDCSCTAVAAYLSSTTFPAAAHGMVVGAFDAGGIGANLKNGSFAARAVRGGF